MSVPAGPARVVPIATRSADHSGPVSALTWRSPPVSLSSRPPLQDDASELLGQVRDPVVEPEGSRLRTISS